MKVARQKDEISLLKYGIFKTKYIFLLLIFSAVAVYNGIHNFLLFHTLIELICVFVGFGVVIVAYNSFNLSKQTWFAYFGISCFFISVFHLLHVLTFEGVSIFPWNDLNTSVQISVAEKYLESFSLLAMLIIPLNLLKEKRFLKTTFYVFTLVSLLLLMSINYWTVFPDCISGKANPTVFKTYSEYIITGLFVIVFIIIIKSKSKMTPNVRSFLFLFVGLKIISQVIFALYDEVYDIQSIIAHIIRSISYLVVYGFIVEASFIKPLNILFYELEQKKNKLLKTSNDLKFYNEKLKYEIEQSVRIEDLLRKSEERYRLLIESVPEAIFVHDDEKVIFSNQAGLKFLGIDSLDWMYESLPFNYLFRENKKELINRLEELKKNGTSPSYSLDSIKSADGTFIDVEIITRRYNYDDTRAYLSVIRDITQRRQIEELKKSVDENSKLLEQATRLDRIKTDFFTDVSHEFRTPLNLIICTIQTIEKGLEGEAEILNNREKMTKYISSMKHNSYRLLRRINNIMDISKIESGYNGLKLKNYDIVGVIEKVTMLVWEYTRKRRVGLMFDSNIDKKVIAFDIDKIERIMLNLLSNAIKFNKEGGMIEVNIYDKDDSILITVKDTGIGIPCDSLDMIFERFKQVENSTANDREGTGIGLYLVKALVEMHGGKISVEGREGEGTTFIVELPATILPDDAENDVDYGSEKYYCDKLNIELSDID